MSKQFEKTADLLIPGNQFLIELINLNNDTYYTVEQVGSTIIIGAPRSSADEIYNTDIEVTFPTEADPVTGELHYERYDLGRLFATKSLSFRDEGYASTADLITPIMAEARIALEPEDLVMEALPAGYPKRVVLKANPLSLRFIGQFSVLINEPFTDDDSIITAPVTAENSRPSNKALKPDGSGTLFAGNGVPADFVEKSSNGEIEVCGSARLKLPEFAIKSVSGEYRLNIGRENNWSFLYSFAFLDNRNADRITDLYDCSIKVTAPGGGILNFEITRQYGRIVLVDTDNQLTVFDEKAVNAQQTLCQDILNVSSYKGKLGTLPLNIGGFPYGTYSFELRATRKVGAFPPVIVLFDAVVEGTPA